jgi:ABC-type branched-subunit amino acid transport system ATPase component
VRGIVDGDGLGVLLVEHDMALVMDVCDHLFTLDFGELIFAGTPAETRASAVVRTAYLGEADGLEAIEDAHLRAESGVAAGVT